MFQKPVKNSYVVDPVTMVGSSLSAPIGAGGRTQYIGEQYLYADRADNPAKQFNDDFWSQFKRHVVDRGFKKEQYNPFPQHSLQGYAENWMGERWAPDLH